MSATIWTTPQAIFDKLNKEFEFEYDLCATPENAKCSEFFFPDSSLSCDWTASMNIWSTAFLNPPYGRQIALWIKKAYQESTKEKVIVALIPGRTNAPWWHDYVMAATEVRFVRKKMPFWNFYSPDLLRR